MSSLIDRMRLAPTTSRTVTVHGFDPDGDTTGWARLNGLIEKPARGPAVAGMVMIGIIEPAGPKRHELEQSEAMIDALWQAQHCVDGGPIHVFVEAQQVYPTPDEDPRKRVAKANDLLRLAQITGAIQAIGHARNAALVRAVLPATWKGQQAKDSTIALCQQRLAGVSVTVLQQRGRPPIQVDGRALDKLPGKLGHALDALGIALYGLDWLSRHEVPAS